VPPYISSAPEVLSAELPTDGFVLLACDGVWDEMTTAQAAEALCGLLDRANTAEAAGEQFDVAGLFIDQVLEAAAVRRAAA
jgi:serine/threonine protein phosphatase PrpC